MLNFPVFLNLTDKKILIVGGNKVALQKVRKMEDYCSDIIVIAPQIIPEIKERKCQCLERQFHEEDLNGISLVIVTTDDNDFNHQVSLICKAHHLLVNVEDDTPYCSFSMPTSFHQGDLSFGISSGGYAPMMAICLKEKIEAVLPEDMNAILLYLNKARARVKNQFSRREAVAEALKKLSEFCLLEGHPLSLEEENKVLDSLR